MSWLFAGGKVVLHAGSLDPEAVWQAVEDERVNSSRSSATRWASRCIDALGRAARALGRVVALLDRQRRRAHVAVPEGPPRRRLPGDSDLTDGFGSSETGAQGPAVASSSRAPRGRARRRASPRSRPYRRHHPVLDDDRRAGRARLGRHRAGRAHRPHPARLLQRPGEDGGDLRRDRRRALGASPATWPPSTRTAPSACSAAARSASTPAARRSSPKRSSRLQGPPRRSTTCWSSASTTSGGASGSARWCSRARRSPLPSTSCASLPGQLAGYKLPKRLVLVDVERIDTLHYPLQVISTWGERKNKTVQICDVNLLPPRDTSVPPSLLNPRSRSRRLASGY